MDKYELLNQIGDGTFGSVAKAVSKKTGQLVAIKKMKQKYYTWDECVRLPEVEVVRRIHGHPNIVKLREVIRENNELFFVFEYMDGDLLGVIRKAKQAQRPEDALTAPAIPYPVVKNYMRQLLQALAYLHRRGYFHRDLKPENLLIKREAGDEEVIKLGDFGLVKDVRARPPYTDYVSTRWYRAPELLLQDRAYGTPVDIWAAGCLMAELITTKPLFPGANEVDQLFKIMNVLGSPDERSWPAGMTLARKIRYVFPSVQGTGLAKALPKHVPAQALDLMQQMLTYDPKVRLSAEQCLQHPFFSVGVDESNGAAGATQEQISDAARRLHASPQSAPAALPIAVAEAQRGKLPCSIDQAMGLTANGASPAAAPPGAASPQKFYMLHQRRGSEMNALPKAAFVVPQGLAKNHTNELDHVSLRRGSMQKPGPSAPSLEVVPKSGESTATAQQEHHTAVPTRTDSPTGPSMEEDAAGARFRSLAAGLKNLSTQARPLAVPRRTSNPAMNHAGGAAAVAMSSSSLAKDATLSAGAQRDRGGGAQANDAITGTTGGSPSKYALANVAHLSPYRPLVPVAKGARGTVASYGAKRNSNPSTTQLTTSTALHPSAPQAGGEAGSPSKNANAEPASGRAPAEPKVGVDLDHLVEEFASELTTLGLNVQKQIAVPRQGATVAGGDPALGNAYSPRKTSLTTVGSVSALLHNTRYKPTTLLAEKRNAGSGANASPYAPRATKGAPEVGARNVSPALRALLAKHRSNSTSFR